MAFPRRPHLKPNMSPPPTPPTVTEPSSNPLPSNPDPAPAHPDETLAAEKPSMNNLATPAPPPRPSTLTAPDAPAQNPPVKGIPASTPAANATPLAGGGRGDDDAESGGVVKGKSIDLSEFDPYATTTTTTTRALGSAFAGRKKKKKSDDAVGLEEPLKRLQEKEEGNARRVEQSVDMAPTGSSQDAARRFGLGEREQASNKPMTPGTSTERDEEASEKDKEPAFNFQGFLKDLKLKSAEPVARYLKSFLSNFVKKPFTVNEQIKLIHDFLAFISEKMVQVEPWKSQSSAEFDNALEAMEKLVMNRLYNYTFTPELVPSQPITTDDLERDRVFSQRVRLFGWIREKHLDVPEGEAAQGFLGFAEQELLKINHYKAPRDKMICILNCCKVIFGLIRNVYGAESGGADAFIPILIFVVLRANPENLISNLEYIQRFRSHSKLQGEAAYYLSSISGAIQFIETMDASSLSNITQPEFESHVEAAIQELPPSPSSEKNGSGMLPLSAASFRTPAAAEKDQGRERRERERDSKLISPFAAATPGDEAARPLSMASAQASLEGTRKWFARTGNLAQEAVSKPLNAIGKILEGMSPADTRQGSEDGSGDEDEEGEGGGGGGRVQGMLTVGETSAGRGPGGVFPRDVFGSRRFRAVTPESPSRRPTFGDEGISRTGTPSSDILPDFSALQIQSSIDASQETYAQTRHANVQTLHQMFPALDEEIVEAVLEGCHDDLGLAIDRLLEM
ncbi:vacuolar protein sorting-associated protein 9 [Cryptococcus neoformans var. grubii Br795]|nr:vacuolar protein sorting-associated protein 9 [Cryptococcus neoformans var. grubii Br795]